MITAYPILKFSKRKKDDIKKMELRNKRIGILKENKNLNYDLVKCDDYMKFIQNRINEGYTKKVIKNAILCVEVMFSISNKEYFDSLAPEEEKLFFEKSLEFIKNKVGEENIIFATVFKDIKVPSIHIGFIPLKDNHLRIRNFLNDKYEIIDLRDNYYFFIKQFFPNLIQDIIYKSALKSGEYFRED